MLLTTNNEYVDRLNSHCFGVNWARAVITPSLKVAKEAQQKIIGIKHILGIRTV